MSDGLATGAVLYAKDMDALARFYAAAAGLTFAGRDDEHVRLVSSTFELVVRQIPESIAARIHVDVPPTRRESAAVKLVFFVRAIGEVRAAVEAHGGVLEERAKPWRFRDRSVWDALDPEGNVIQFRAPADPAGD